MKPDEVTVTRVTDLIRNRLDVQVPTADTDLFESGLLDSLALVNLIAALEEEFTRELLLDDFDFEWFRNVRKIAEFVALATVAEDEVTS